MDCKNFFLLYFFCIEHINVVVEVVSSNTAKGDVFTTSIGIFDLLHLCIYLPVSASIYQNRCDAFKITNIRYTSCISLLLEQPFLGDV